MSYQVHNFQTGDVIEAFPVNEMDAQIQLNETNIAQKIDISKKGAANGVAELDSSGKVPTSQLPSYVDDVLEYNSRSDFPATGEAGKIYVAKDTNLTYRWSGSDYVEISPSLALGETSATAYRGDRGKTAYDHATESGKISAAVSTNLYKISVTGQGHIGSVTPAEKADLVGLGVLDGNQGVANAGKFMKVGADGSLVPSNVDMSAKADKPSNPTDGDLAALDANGNLVDSGKKTSDFVPVTREINGHALSSDFNISKSDVGLGNVDNTSDANKPVSTAQQTALNGKTDKVSGATNGNFAGLDANGNLTDSGKKASDFLGTSTIDDTAGIGDTDKTWSADKLAKEENKIKQVISFDPSAMEAAIADVTGVTHVSINVNNTDETVGDFPARSVAAVVLNGNASNIASAIWNHLPELYSTYGVSSQTVTDTEGTHTVYYSRPTIYTVGVHVRIKKYDGYDPESVDSDIKTALRTYINESVNIGESLNVLTLHGIVNKTAVAYEGMYEIKDLYCTVGGVDEWVLLSHGWRSKYAVNSVNDITITYEDGVEIDDTAGIGDTDFVWSADKTQKELNTKADAIGIVDDTAEAVKTIPDGADGIPMVLKVGIEPVQSGSGDPSPTNIRPISGWTGANVTRTGKNLIPDGKDTSKGYVANRFLSYNGNLNASSTDYYVSEYFRVVPGANYVWGLGSGISETGKNNPSMCFYDANKDFIIGIQMSYIVSHPGVVPENAVYARSSQVKNPVTTVPFIFEYGTEATPYEDYNSDSATYSVTFPSSAGTVYGGTLTVNNDGTGTLVVDRASVDLGALSWTAHVSVSNLYYATISGIKSSSTNFDRNTGIICSNYPPDTQPNISNDMNDKHMLRYTSSRLFIRDNDYENATSFKSAMSGVQLVYELATPVTYELTALEVIETLKGTNNIFADTGDILSVDYSADTKMYVDAGDENKQEQIDITRGMIADSDTLTAMESHAIGDVFICNNKLLRATDTIATGETVIIGSNAEEITLAEYIAEVVESLGVVKNDVSVLKSYPVPSDYFLLKKLGFTDFTAGSGSQGTLKMESNVLTFSGGSGTTYCHFNLLGSHRIKSGTWGNYTPLPEDFAPIDELFKLDNSNVKRRYCLNTNGDIITGTGSGSTMRALLMKDNGDGTYTYKYAGLGTIRGNIPLRSESMDIADWDGIAIVFTSTARPINITVYFSIEEGEGGEYTWLDK